MRKLQEIFDTVIKSRLYKSGDYMCNSLKKASRQGVISYDERKKALQAIDKYMDHIQEHKPHAYHPPPLALIAALRNAGVSGNLPDNDLDTMRIYKNWKRRPRFYPTIQDTFNKVIEGGWYRPDCAKTQYDSKVYPKTTVNGFSECMCISITLAHEQGAISKSEADKATLSIQRYMNGHNGTLEYYLTNRTCSKRGEHGTPEELMYIYKNWKKRPELKE